MATQLFVTLTSSDNKYLRHPCKGWLELFEIGRDGSLIVGVWRGVDADGKPLGGPVEVRDVEFTYPGVGKPTLTATDALNGFVTPALPTIEAAHAMGAKGAEPTEAERLLFEAWMRGHCWALSATWRGTQYKSDCEEGGDLDPRAMQTRQLWAAWRDRAALTA